MTVLLVSADDRTGALEVAGACAEGGTGPVLVVTTGPPGLDGVVVVDLGTRHLTSQAARRRAASLQALDVSRQAHKIDSLLRGRWADELVARVRAGARVLVVPALPAAGRTCVDGVVLEAGRPVHEGPAGLDARDPLRSSRPAEHLRIAGAPATASLAGPADVVAWLAGDGGVAVCDATSDGDLEVVAEAWSAGPTGVVLAGTSAIVGRAAAKLVRGSTEVTPPLNRPQLVVCGSLHPTARAQVEALGRAGIAVLTPEDPGAVMSALRAGGVACVAIGEPDQRPVPPAAAAAAAARLAGLTRPLLAGLGTAVLIGGDTAAAVLGEGPRLVGGMVAPGTPWSRPPSGAGPLVVTRAGGFGDEASLVRLVSGRLGA